MILHIRKMADYNLLLVAIPRRYPQVWAYKPKKLSLQLYFDMIFIPDLGRNFWDIFPQIFLTFRVWIQACKIGSRWTTVTWTYFDQRYLHLACELPKVNFKKNRVEQIFCACIRLLATRFSKSINFSLWNTLWEAETGSVRFWLVAELRIRIWKQK